MKPLALRLQAFGSYAGQFAVDFARLGRHGVFSITGPTGSGKSTIFDAIVYALYDDLPGFRVNSHIRSQYADPAIRTEVILEFQADGRHWVLTRSPAQSRPSSRSTMGAVQDASTVVLEEAGVAGSAITKKREVAERIGELVGLDKGQFEQVVLIPQGQFEEVLKAKTQDRADLLAKLFPVDVYIRTTEALGQLAAERKEAYDALSRGRTAIEDRIAHELAAVRSLVRPTPIDGEADNSAAGDVGDVDRSGVVQLDDLRAELGALVAATEAARDRAGDERERARSVRAALDDQVVRWRQWRTDTVEARSFADQEATDALVAKDLERAVAVATLANALHAWRRAVDLGDVLGVAHRQLRAGVEARWDGAYDAAALEGSGSAHRLAATVSADARALERADAAFVDLDRRARDLDADETDVAARTTALAAAVEARAELETRRRAVEVARAAATRRVAGRSEAVADLERLERDRAAVRARLEVEQRIERLGVQLEAAAVAAAAASSRWDHLRTAWHAGLAGRLATHLVDGRPCPTCGAAEHPDPAAVTADAPGDDELERAEAAAADLAEARQRLEVQVGEARGTLASIAVVADPTDLEVRLDAARRALKAIEVAVIDEAALESEIDHLVSREKGADIDIADARSTLDRLSAVVTDRRDRWTADRNTFVAEHGSLASTSGRAARLAGLATAVEEFAANLEAGTAAETARLQHLDALATTMAEFGVGDPAGLEQWARTAEEIAVATRLLAERAEHRRDVSARIEAYAADGGPVDEPDPAPAAAVERAAVAAHDDLVGREAEMSSRMESVEAAAAELAEGIEVVGAALRAKEEADTLAGLCAGAGTGPDATRLSLKNWVLAYYLRQVLAHANRRLLTMTHGRYALDLSGEHADGRRPWGLDISVLDAETGQSRPATTLSGGETFMAALSLALGLADVVSAGSNYSIGALFVDEGFGSLDADSLDMVIEVLRSLQDGGRMVGVISHMQELKDALPSGITIVSSNHGSEATINYPDP